MPWRLSSRARKITRTAAVAAAWVEWAAWVAWGCKRFDAHAHQPKAGGRSRLQPSVVLKPQGYVFVNCFRPLLLSYRIDSTRVMVYISARKNSRPKRVLGASRKHRSWNYAVLTAM